MGERLVILAVGVAAALVVYALWRLWQRRRLATLRAVTAPIHVPAAAMRATIPGWRRCG